MMKDKKENFFTKYELFHGNFNRVLAIMFAITLILNVLDVDSTYKVIESGAGYELNEKYDDEVNSLDFSSAIAGKIIDLTKMMVTLLIFVLSTEYIIYVNHNLS